MRTFFALLAVLASAAVLAQAYRWVDADGIVHYSDRPVEGAERIFLPESTHRTRTIAPRRTAETPEAPPDTAAQGPFRYDTVEVVAPAPEQTLWNLEGVLNVSLRVQPALRPGDQVRVYFDGEQRPVRGTNFQIDGVFRGVHNIQAEIVDQNGQTLGRSLPNRFYVQQNSIIRAN